ncbi:hypothetical protein EM595_1843 [Duffyella gerundensis]|jgi:hypothetical protein|uniref:Uncharacterized protein n=1 Tax=Duffyella gerundensis TaxID=1619313 RepID=A0A0U5EA59_9GAMM|nr:hypothetical protein EM595_1843 [Duffyella gerundensis]
MFIGDKYNKHCCFLEAGQMCGARNNHFADAAMLAERLFFRLSANTA